MIKRIIIGTAAILLVLVCSLVLFRKRTVPLISNGRIVAVATRPLAPPWKDNEFGVYAAGTKVFSLWGDVFHWPLFIYPFADGQRFLCIDDDDTTTLVFIVDLDVARAKALSLGKWPNDDSLRAYFASRPTNVVMETKGVVRLPNYAELQEVSGNLARLKPSQFRAASFPICDLGLYRIYLPKERLLAELSTNRTSVWP